MDAIVVLCIVNLCLIFIIISRGSQRGRRQEHRKCTTTTTNSSATVILFSLKPPFAETKMMCKMFKTGIFELHLIKYSVF